MATDPKHTRIGEDAKRHEGRLKVTGQARYPSDMPLVNPAYAYLVTSAIARGRIKGFDLSAARVVPGYLETLTFQNTQGQIKPMPVFFGKPTLTLETDEIQHDGQIIAVVLADSYEAAREAAYKVKVDYAAETPTFGFDSAGATVKAQGEPAIKGDAAAAFAAAPVKIEAQYETPTQHHNQMELYTTTCEWAEGKLTVHEPTQGVNTGGALAKAFGIPPADVHILSRFVGGGFGGKMSGNARTFLIALAAKRLNRPVKLVATRADGFSIASYRAETRHHVKLGASRDGRLTAFVHEGEEVSSRVADYTVGGMETTSKFYNYETVATKLKVVNADRNTPGFMRAPAEAPYMFALESAMDELAVALDMDPVELRLKNDTQVDPVTGHPFTSRRLKECLEEGAKTFGWSRRNPAPRSHAEGDWLVGWGVASACYPASVGASACRVSLTAAGEAKVQVGFIDMGQGSYTMVAQVAADRLGLPIQKVAVELGDNHLPPGTMAGGSIGAASTANAVAKTCEQLRVQLAEGAIKDGLHTGADPATLTLVSGGLKGPKGIEPLAKAVGRFGAAVEASGGYEPVDAPPGALQRLAMGIPTFVGGLHAKDYVGMSFGANFVEVRVHRMTGEIRVSRMVGVYAAGTIISRTMAHSQMTGGQVWGVGSALHESTDVDPRAARYTNDNFADYLIPVNADIPASEVAFLPETESRLNPLGVKGVGELGVVGVNAAIANAVYHATGKRIRRLPIRIEDVI